MGLGIYTKGEIQKPFFIPFGRKSTDFSAIKKFLTYYSKGMFANFLSFSGNDDELEVTIHPCEEPLRFRHVEGAMTCSARTNSVGPGYHAYVVDMLDNMAKDLRIKWNWDLEEGEEYFEDETGYYQHRDYDKLQLKMLRWLKALCNHYEPALEDAQIMLSLPIGFPRMRRDYFAVSQVGLWDKDWFQKVAALHPEHLYWAGREFFIWWNQQPDAAFYVQTAIALMNVECPWHMPIDDEEKKLMRNVDQCLEMARKIDPFIEVPEDDWRTIKEFLSEDDATIHATPYGYRKYEMTFDLPDNWLIDLPGTMYHAVDENTQVYYDHIRTVRSLAYSIKGKEKADVEYAETFFKDRQAEAGTETIGSSTNLAGKAVIYYQIDDEQQSEYWILQGVKVKDDKFLLSTICYPTEEYKQWAIDTWDSMRR